MQARLLWNQGFQHWRRSFCLDTQEKPTFYWPKAKLMSESAHMDLGAEGTPSPRVSLAQCRRHFACERDGCEMIIDSCYNEQNKAVW